MFLKARDRIKKFYDLIAESNEFIKKEKYEDAIGLYNHINSAYESIPVTMRTEALTKNLDKLNRELILYLKIKEIQVLITNKNFSKIPEIIEYMGMIVNKLREDTPKPISLIKFGEEKISYYNNLHKQEYEKDLFNRKYERIRDAIKKGDKKRAFLLFEDLKTKVKDVEKYGKALELYEKIEKIREKIEKPELIKHKATEYYEHKLPKKEEPKKEVKKEEKKEIIKEENPDQELSKIHDLLNKNQLEEAKKILKRL